MRLTEHEHRVLLSAVAASDPEGKTLDEMMLSAWKWEQSLAAKKNN